MQLLQKSTRIILLISLSVWLTACGGGGGGGGSNESDTLTSANPTLSFELKTFLFTWTDVSSASHYRLLENPDGFSGFSQISGDIPKGTKMFEHIVPLYMRVNASYILQTCDSNGCIDSNSINVSDSLVNAIGYFKPNNTGRFDHFGGSISLSDDGAILVVGANNEDGSNANAGAAYVFIRNGNNWDQQAYIKASNAGELDLFGHRVFISGDGNTLAVSAVGEDSSTHGINTTPNESAMNSGAVYIYSWLWGQQAYIKGSNTGADDQFGSSVSLSNDGNTMAVGAAWDDFRGTDAGAVYVFNRSGFNWSEQAYIKASNAGPGHFLGGVSLSGDGNTLAVAASREDSSTSGINTTPDILASNSGAVYVFTRSGVTWTEQAYIKASNSESGDLFGSSVSLSNSGNTMAVGANNEDSSTSGINTTPDNLASNSGAVYVFTRTGTSWAQQAYIKPSNIEFVDQFGGAVSLSSDGDILAVSSGREDSSTIGINSSPNDLAVDSGAAWVFKRNGITWVEQAYIKASNTEAGDTFGNSVSLSGDGNTLAIGANQEDGGSFGIDGDQTDNSAESSGAVYLY
jgi:hypothetical protein